MYINSAVSYVMGANDDRQRGRDKGVVFKNTVTGRFEAVSIAELYAHRGPQLAKYSVRMDGHCARQSDSPGCTCSGSSCRRPRTTHRTPT